MGIVKPEGVTFGLFLRCLRLRWHPVAENGRYYCIRMHHICCEPYRSCVEFCPLDPKQVKDGKKIKYLLFDSAKDLNRVIDSSPVLRCVRRVKKYFRLVLDENGEVAR